MPSAVALRTVAEQLTSARGRERKLGGHIRNVHFELGKWDNENSCSISDAMEIISLADSLRTLCWSMKKTPSVLITVPSLSPCSTNLQRLEIVVDSPTLSGLNFLGKLTQLRVLKLDFVKAAIDGVWPSKETSSWSLPILQELEWVYTSKKESGLSHTKFLAKCHFPNLHTLALLIPTPKGEHVQLASTLKRLPCLNKINFLQTLAFTAHYEVVLLQLHITELVFSMWTPNDQLIPRLRGTTVERIRIDVPFEAVMPNFWDFLAGFRTTPSNIKIIQVSFRRLDSTFLWDRPEDEPSYTSEQCEVVVRLLSLAFALQKRGIRLVDEAGRGPTLEQVI
jgi:hypothetical protein